MSRHGGGNRNGNRNRSGGAGGGRVADQAVRAKEVAQTAAATLRSGSGGNARNGSNNRNGNGGGVVANAVSQVGDRLDRAEVRDLRRQGLNSNQIQRVAGRVDEVGGGAQAVLDRMQQRDGGAGGNGGNNRNGGNNSNGSDNSNGGSNSNGGNGGGTQPGNSYGTADRTGWLAAELKAVDTFRPDTTPVLFNNYRPTDLSSQMRDAVDEANQFIDTNSALWRPAKSSWPPEPSDDDGKSTTVLPGWGSPSPGSGVNAWGLLR